MITRYRSVPTVCAFYPDAHIKLNLHNFVLIFGIYSLCLFHLFIFFFFWGGGGWEGCVSRGINFEKLTFAD